MKYNRFKEIYQTMSYELIDKFFDKFHFYPMTENDFVDTKFIDSIQEFIISNRDNPVIMYACMIFPELSEVPHPDKIPEKWGLLPKARETLKNAYIEKIELENQNLLKKLDELKKIIEELTEKTSESEENFLEHAEEMVHTVDLEFDINRITASIYRKFFVPPTPKNRYQLLTDEEKDWIRANVELSDMHAEIFDLCCVCVSLKEVSEKMEITHTRIKHFSSAIIKSVKAALVQVNPNFISEAANG